jgi:SAM-dependent methyltransferase
MRMASEERLNLSDPDWGEFLFHCQRYAIARRLSAGARVLDCGCGEGYGAAFLSQVAAQVAAFDLAADAITKCVERYGSLPNLAFSVGDITRLPYPDGSFDVVACFELIEHIPEADHPQAFDEIRRVMKPDGVLVISSPNKLVGEERKYQNPYHIAEMPFPSFREEMQQRFAHVDTFGQDLNLVSVMWRDLDLLIDQPTPRADYIDQSIFANFVLEEKIGHLPCYYVVALCSDQPLPDLRGHVFAFHNREPAHVLWRAAEQGRSDALLPAPPAEDPVPEALISALQDLGARWDDEMAALRAQAALDQSRVLEQDARLRDQDARQQEQDARLREQETRLHEQAAELRAQDGALHAREAQIRDLEGQLAEARARIGSGLEQVEILNALAATLSKKAVEAAAECASLRQSVAANTHHGEQVDILNHALGAMARQLEEGQRTLDTLRRTAHDQEARVAAYRLREAHGLLGQGLRGRFGRDRRVLKPVFDAPFYLARNPDVAAAGHDPLTHYLEHGFAEGRWPHPLFDTRWYLATYEDVRHAGINPFRHFITHGQFEKRNPNALFHSGWYLETNPDVAASKMSAFQHYIEHGFKEQRAPGPTFSASAYFRAHRDLPAGRIDPLAHALHGR